MKKWMSGTRRIILLGIALVALAVMMPSIPGHLGGGQPAWRLPGNGSSPRIALAAPPQQLADTFDSQSAGISAYVNIGSRIDLAKIAAMGVVQEKRSSYVVVFLGEAGAFIYASDSGWVVAYLHREPTAKMVRWFRVGDSAPALTKNRLQFALESAVDKIGVDWGSLKAKLGYYHFGYPSATQLVFFAKGMYGGLSPQVSFNVPGSYSIYEASWAMTTQDDCSRDYFELDGQKLCASLGIFSGLTPDSNHSLNLVDTWTTGWTGVAGFLVLN
jgi:hypothetical protein